MHNARRVFAALLTLLALAAALPPSRAVTQDEIDSLITQASGIQEEQAALQQEINSYTMSIAAALEQKTFLDAAIAQIEEEVAALEAQISDCRQRIYVTETELADAQRREAEQYDLFCQRVRVMEEQGRVNCWMILLHATSFVDFLSRLDFVNEIMQSDQRVMDDLRAPKQNQLKKNLKQTSLNSTLLLSHSTDPPNGTCMLLNKSLDIEKLVILEQDL